MIHRIQHQLSAYLDSELPPDDMDAVGRHLVECEECRRELDQLRATKQVLGRLTPPALPADFTAGVWERIDRSEPRRRWMPWLPVRRPGLALAALALAILLLGVPVMKGRLERLRAAEVGPDAFMRFYLAVAAEDPFADRAFLGLIHSDAGLRLVGEDPRGRTQARGETP